MLTQVRPTPYWPLRPPGFRVAALAIVAWAAAALGGCGTKKASVEETASAGVEKALAEDQPLPPVVAEGQRVFRFDTFGDEQFWTDTLGLHQVIEQHVDPTTALEVGLNVDVDALPPGILESADLGSPATTVARLKLNAVLGIQATVDSTNHITRLGVTCALCPSTVDNSAMPGIGHRRAVGGVLGRCRGGSTPRGVRCWPPTSTGARRLTARRGLHAPCAEDRRGATSASLAQ